MPNVKLVKEGHNGLLRIRLNEDKTKHSIVFVFSKCKEAKNVGEEIIRSSGHFSFVLEREPQASL